MIVNVSLIGQVCIVFSEIHGSEKEISSLPDIDNIDFAVFNYCIVCLNETNCNTIVSKQNTLQISHDMIIKLLNSY